MNRTMNRLFLGLMAAAALMMSAPRAESATVVAIARPSNPGGPGSAVALVGNAKAGAKIFAANCADCHGMQGKGGVTNAGSADGTVPPLNPIDETMMSRDPKTFGTNIDRFIEHGSTPDGPGPAISMPAWGADKMLKQQEIADVIAYIISLNPVK